MKSLLILLSLVSLATARIGETPAQCNARYGEPVKIDKADQSIIYSKAGFSLVIDFHEGKACQLVIGKGEYEFGSFDKMSDAEREALLEANAGEGEWDKDEQLFEVSPEWENIKEKLHAKYIEPTEILVIATEEKLLRDAAEKEAKEKAALEGF